MAPSKEGGEGRETEREGGGERGSGNGYAFWEQPLFSSCIRGRRNGSESGIERALGMARAQVSVYVVY
jgi:hypothetical protein